MWKVSLPFVNFAWGCDAKEQTNYSTLGLTFIGVDNSELLNQDTRIIYSFWQLSADNSLLTTIKNVKMVYMNVWMGFDADDIVLW